MNPSPQSPTPEELKNLESDPVWTLLDQASHQEASNDFVDNVMNVISSEVPDNVVTSPSFWQRHSLAISAAAVAGIAACVMFATNFGDSQQDSPVEIAESKIQFTVEELASFEAQMASDESSSVSEIDLLAEQMIEIDNEDPFIMTADEINVLVTM